ncbi:hypothetical protein C8Q79DRAFT_880323, partial [Trametes meyenii]
MRAFIQELLHFRKNGPHDEGGILGHVKSYYGCVEAQGRGTLHCHMMVWVEGSLNPKDLQEKLKGSDHSDFGARLIEFLDDTISNSIPELGAETETESGSLCSVEQNVSKLHPDTHRGFDLTSHGESLEKYRIQDLHNLVQKNQIHRHTETCYKYCGTGPPKCRFDLDEDNTIPATTYDPETGELTLRISDGMANNYNPTLLEALRCNIDIQYIGCGEEAKAVIYYITDYITKSPLKAHVAYAALELALKKLNDIGDIGTVEPIEKARRVLQRTAFSIVSNQELSGQQVASYLLNFEDHFTSHKFANLYWPSFERLVDKIYPIEDTTNSEMDIPTSNSEHEQGPEDYETGSETAMQNSIDHDEFEEDNMLEDDVRIDTANSGEVVELSSQLADYLCRGSRIADMTL